MNFPSEPKFAESLTILANTFRYRIGGMVLLATVFLTREAPHFSSFSAIICIWIAFETLNKVYMAGRKNKTDGE